MSRISLVTRFENSERQMLNNARDLNETNEIISSGKRVREPSDDPTEIVNINQFSNRLGDIEQFKNNIDSGRSQLENTESLVERLRENLQRVRELAVQGNNGDLTSQDRSNLADEVNERLEEMVNVGNAKLGGQYIFSGAATLDEKPFQVERTGNGEIIDVIFKGDRVFQKKQVGEEQSIPSNLLGNETFQATNQGIIGGTRFDGQNDLDDPLDEATLKKPGEIVPSNQKIQNDGTSFGSAPGVSLEVENISKFSKGDKIKIFDQDTSEQTEVLGVDKDQKSITVDLQNSYQTSDDPEISFINRDNAPQGEGFFQVNDTEIHYDASRDSIQDIAKRINERGLRVKASFVDQKGNTFDPDELSFDDDSNDNNYRFQLESRTPHKIYLRDIDRNQNSTPNKVEGLLNDLRILGDGDREAPELQEEQDFPNPYHNDAKVTGKSTFDVLVDLRESLQSKDDADSGEITEGSPDVGGEAATNRVLDPNTKEGISQAIGETDKAIENVLRNQSIVGARLNRHSSAKSRMEDFDLNTNRLLSQIQDANLAEVITDFRRNELVQQASLRMSSQVLSQSLTNFI